MKVIIAGTRSIDNPQLVEDAVKESQFRITEVVSGHAPGVDQLGEEWARLNGIPFRLFPAEWAKHGRAAGPIRNDKMAEYADGLIAVWDGQSRGTKHMIEAMRRRSKAVYVKNFNFVAPDPTTRRKEVTGL